jgi:hypothetical protein
MQATLIGGAFGVIGPAGEMRQGRAAITAAGEGLVALGAERRRRLTDGEFTEFRLERSCLGGTCQANQQQGGHKASWDIHGPD